MSATVPVPGGMNVMIEEDSLEVLKKELAKPEAGPPERIERRKPGKKRVERGSHALPCADMTCPCRIIGDR